MKGKLFVIEGIDGSGKETQSKMLVERLKKEKHLSVKYIAFPQYGKPSAWPIEQFLNGELGALDEIKPKIAAIFYAYDRLSAKSEIEKWLKRGEIVIANRYTPSNMGHQAARIKDSKEKKAFIKWVEMLEYDIFKLPRPHKVILLTVDPKIAQTLIGRRKKKNYLKTKKKDLLENDVGYLRRAQETYLHLAKIFNWEVIKCSPNGKLLSVEEIHRHIWNLIQSSL